MRLWDCELLNCIPSMQLKGQWRECCLIAKNIKEKGTPNHLLVNKIMDYPIDHFIRYSRQVYFEMKHRGYNANIQKFAQYVDDIHAGWNMQLKDVFPDWHGNLYRKINYYNLLEKFMSGGIPEDEWQYFVDGYRRLEQNG